ncbi:hypothetical protein AABB24_021118, partial [Solanum stoloniferum]
SPNTFLTMKASEIPSSSQHLLENEEQPTTHTPNPTPTPTPTKNSKKLALIPLIFIIFFEVSGGPYGAEAAIGAAGPLLAVLGFLIFPFIWSVPEALVTAELATTFPAGIVTCISYVLPLLGTSGAVPLEQGEWIDGYFANLASMIAGNWLKYWMELGIVLSVIGLYEAQLSSCAYQILGMAEMGLLPRVIGVRSEWFNTPWVGILVPTLVALVVSYMTFTDIVSSVNFLYSLGMLLEFASFLWLRRKMPKAKRPYRVPLSMPGLMVMCFIPSCFLVYVMFAARRTVYIVSALLTVFAIAWYFFMEFCKTKMWFDFETVDQDKVDDEIF